MQLRSGRRLVSPPPGGRRRCSRRPGGGNGEDADRFSSLPEDLLLDILGRLGSAREAARTSMLSRRWNGLWTELRKLEFRGIMAVNVKRALAQVRPGLNGLDIYIDKNMLIADGIKSMLSAADRLAPSELVVTYNDDNDRFNGGFDIELPCFHRTTSFVLVTYGTYINLSRAAAGKFHSLERLKMQFDCGFDALEDLIRCCPRLRELQVNCIDVTDEMVTFESNSLEKLEITIQSIELCSERTLAVDVVAPELKEFVLVSSHTQWISVSLSAPKLDRFLTRAEYFICFKRKIGLGDRWQLSRLRMEMARSVHVQVLSLMIITDYQRATADRSFAEEITRLPVNDYSVLNLSIGTEGHVFGPLVLHLLGIRTSIERLKLVLTESKSKECSSENCDCDQDTSWRKQRICLPRLKHVEIRGFSAADHVLDFLEVVFRSAPMLKRMTIELSDEIPPISGMQRLHGKFESYASVECSIHYMSDEVDEDSD